MKAHTVGESRASNDFLAFSNSFLCSDFKKNVVWRVFWFVEASSLTLCCDMTCFMISPRVVGLPSLPAADKSTTGVVKDSEKTGCLEAVALIRGAAVQVVETAGLPTEEGARDGNASAELVSTPPFAVGAA